MLSTSSSRSDEEKPRETEVAHVLLDASAVLAVIWREPGAEVVRAAMRDGAAISTVNLAEVAALLHHRGWRTSDVENTLTAFRMDTLPFDSDVALSSGALRPATAPAGLGLGDRACLATAAFFGLPVLTTDRSWLRVELEGIEVQVIR